jgi:hypothetical protein
MDMHDELKNGSNYLHEEGSALERDIDEAKSKGKDEYEQSKGYAQARIDEIKHKLGQ